MSSCLVSKMETCIAWLSRVVYLVVALSRLTLVDCISLAPVYWNSSNSLFKLSRNDHVIEVQLYDDIDVVCPLYPAATATDDRPMAHFEYYVIYRVKRSDYENCIVDIDNGALMVLNCSEPTQRRRFTILFEPYQSIPNVPEYHPGNTYYFITTSSGDRTGIAETHRGACANRNMRLAVKVCCHPPSVETTGDKSTVYEPSNVIDSLIQPDADWSPPDRQLSFSTNHKLDVTSSSTSTPSLLLRHMITWSYPVGRRKKIAAPTATTEKRKVPVVAFSSDVSDREIRDENSLLVLRQSMQLTSCASAASDVIMTVTSSVALLVNIYWFGHR